MKAFGSRKKISILYVFIDVFFIALSFYIPYILRYSENPFLRHLAFPEKWVRLSEWALGPYTVVFFFWGFLCVIFLSHYNLYRTVRGLSYLDETVLVGKAIFLASLSAAGAVFFLQIKIYSRLVFAVNVASLMVTLSCWRILKRYLVRRRVARGFNNLHVLIVGAGKVGRSLARELTRNRYLGLEMMGFLDDSEQGEVAGYPVLGSCPDFEKIVRQKFIDEVLISIPSERNLVSRLIMSARKLGIGIQVVPDLLSLGMEGIRAGYLGPIPLLEYYGKGLHKADLLLKRSFDIVVSALALIMIFPLMLIIGLLIKITSPGPVFYVSRRCGKKGKVFKFYKLRTMVKDADRMREELRHLDETDGPVFKIRKDPRVTGLGRFLRRYSLDELPQLWNVLKGDMSLVGPRPPTPEEVEEYHDWQLKRLEIRPGMTCLWQVKGRSDLSFREWMKLDLFYIENWSFWLDIKILFLTFLAVFRGKGAY